MNAQNVVNEFKALKSRCEKRADSQNIVLDRTSHLQLLEDIIAELSEALDE